MLQGDERILTEKGYKRVKDLKKGDKIYNHKHELVTVKEVKSEKAPSFKVVFAKEIYEPIRKGSRETRCVAVHYHSFTTRKNQLWLVTGWSIKRADYEFVDSLVIAQSNARNEKKQNEKNGTNHDTNAIILKDLQDQIPSDGVRYSSQLTPNLRMLTYGKESIFFTKKFPVGKQKQYSVKTEETKNSSCILECGLCTFLE